jgi:hypothetical protein
VAAAATVAGPAAQTTPTEEHRTETTMNNRLPAADAAGTASYSAALDLPVLPAICSNHDHHHHHHYLLLLL